MGRKHVADVFPLPFSKVALNSRAAFAHRVSIWSGMRWAMNNLSSKSSAVRSR